MQKIFLLVKKFKNTESAQLWILNEIYHENEMKFFRMPTTLKSHCKLKHGQYSDDMVHALSNAEIALLFTVTVVIPTADVDTKSADMPMASSQS